ncbi:MAG: c-type cytochrome [Cupriavidus necator]
MRTRFSDGLRSLGLCAVLVAPAAWAAPPEQLARDAGCMSCHATAEKVVGPAFKSIAEKYRGQADAADRLTQSVRNGSRGTWGRIPMPPNGSVAEADARQLVTWILSH